MKSSLSFTLLVLVLSVLILVGCAAPAAVPKPTPASAPAAAAPSPSPAVAPKPAPAPAPAPVSVKPIELKYAHQNPPTTRTALEHLNPWSKKVEEAAKGRVKITMYPAESLAKANQLLEACKSGICDITWIIGGYFPGRFPLTEVSSLPFLNLSEGKVDGRTLSGGAINSRIMHELYETLPEIQAEWAEYKVLYLYTTDPYFMVTSKKPVRNMADLKGMKIRELGGPPLEMWKRLGATPLLKPMPECYELLQKGIIDGMGITWANLTSYKIHEVVKYWTNVPTTIAFFGIIMNKDKWNSLPSEIQQAIQSVSGLSGAEYGGEKQCGLAVKEDALASAKKGGFTLQQIDLDAGEYEKWVEVAGKPVWESWVAEKKDKGPVGQKVLDTMRRLVEKYKK